MNEFGQEKTMNEFDNWWNSNCTGGYFIHDYPNDKAVNEAAFLAGAAAMKERCAEVAEAMSMRAMEYADNMVAGKRPMQIPDYTERNGYRRVAAAIRGMEI